MADGFRVHLKSLRDFADELNQLHELTQQPAQKLESLGGDEKLAFGAFAEAYSFSEFHSELAKEMDALLEKVRAGVDFAGRVTDQVADNYEALNAQGVRTFSGVADALAVPAYTGTATPPAGSVAGPDVVGRLVLPATNGSVYARDENGNIIRVTIQAQDS